MRIQNSRCWKPWDWVVEEDSNWHQGLEPLRHQLVECQWQGRGGPRYSTAHPPSFETHDWPAADACCSQLPPASMWHRFDFPAPVVQLGVGPHFLSHVAGAPPPPNRHVSHDYHTLTHTNPGWDSIALPPAIRAPSTHRVAPAEHESLDSLYPPLVMRVGRELSARYNSLPSLHIFLSRENCPSGGPHWLGLEGSLCE